MSATITVMQNTVRLFGAMLLCLNWTPAMADACKDLEATTTPALFSNQRRHDRQLEATGRIPQPGNSVILIGDSLLHKWRRPPAEYFNFALGGDRTQSILWRLQHADERLKNHPFKTIVILIGTNNIPRNQPCAVIAGIYEVVKVASGMWPKAKIVLMSIPNRIDHRANEPARAEVNEAIRAMASKNRLTFFDTDKVLACGDPAVCDQYVPDGLHISRAGYKRIKEGLETIISGRH